LIDLLIYVLIYVAKKRGRVSCKEPYKEALYKTFYRLFIRRGDVKININFEKKSGYIL